MQQDPIPHDDLNKRHPGISPDVSPILETDRRQSKSSFCVSPIGDGDQFPRGRKETRSFSSPSSTIPDTDHANAPAQSRLQPVQPAQDSRRFISGKLTRWDDFSGEPTSSDAGKASQVDPRSTSFHKPSGSHSTNLLNWGHQFNPKKKINAARSRISSFSKAEDHYHKNTRNRSSSRVFPVEEHSNRRKGAPDATPQLDDFSFSPSVVTTITAGGPVLFPPRPATEHAPIRPQEDKPVLKLDDDISNMMFPSNEPMSRFSATTYTATEPGSQNASPRESMQLETRSVDDVSTSSIMARRRPIPAGLPTSKKQPTSTKPVRKPTPSQVAEQVVQMPAELSPSPPPPEVPLDAQGRIEAMEARRDELTQRRFTLETVISELNKALQPTSTVYDLAAKAEVQKSVKSMESEIADIRKEEHDLGMKITRAWRRLDEKENAGDGTNLWVKRVTS